MVIRKKSKEELMGQVEGFLEYEKYLWNVTTNQADKILEVLGGKDVDMYNKEQVKELMKGILNPDEFDQFYGEYFDYTHVLKKLREAFIKKKIFPDEYTFLLNKFIGGLGSDIDGIMEEVSEITGDELENLRNDIKGRFLGIEDALGLGNKRDLLKLDRSILFDDRNGDIGRIKLLKELGVADISNINKYEELIKYGDEENIRLNFIALKEAGIDVGEDFYKFEKLIKYKKPETIKLNILALKEVGFDVNKNIDDENLIYLIGYGETEKIKSNISALEEAGIDVNENFNYDLRFLILEGEAEKIKSNISALKEAGIYVIENLGKLTDLIMYGGAEKVKSNILALKEAGIDVIGNLGKLRKMIMDGEAEKIKFIIPILKGEGFDIVEDFEKVEDIIVNGEIGKVKSNISVLKEAGIDVNKNILNGLSFLITDGETEKIKSNISALKEAGIDVNENFNNDLRFLIIYGEAEKIKSNIIALKEAGIDVIKNLGKMTGLIRNGEAEKIKSNISALKEAGIDVNENFNEDVWYIIGGEIERVKLNISALKEAGVDMVENLGKLKGLIRNGEAEKIKSNIIALKEAGIDVNENFNDALMYIIDGEAEKVKSNILALKEAGVDMVENLWKLRDLIKNGEVEKIKSNIIALREAGIDVNENLNDENLIYLIRNGEAEKIKSNIIALKEAGIDVNENLNDENLIYLIRNGEAEKIESNIIALREAGIDVNENLGKMTGLIRNGEAEKIKSNIIALREAGIDVDENLGTLESLIKNGEAERVKSNILVLRELCIDVDKIFGEIQGLILKGEAEKIKSNILVLRELGIDVDGNLGTLESLIRGGKAEKIKSNISALKEAGIDVNKNIDDDNFIYLILEGEAEKIKSNILVLKEVGIDVVENFWKLAHPIARGGLIEGKFRESDHKGYFKYIQKIIDSFKIKISQKIALISDVLKLSFSEIEDYLHNYEEVCINREFSYSDFLRIYGKNLNKKMQFKSRGFEFVGPDTEDDTSMLNYSIKQLYPGLDIKFNEIETKKILKFLDSLGGIDKGYTILVLTMEKMVRDGIDGKDFNYVLCEKLGNYQKVFEMYPEDKIPEGLKISIGMEFEITKLFSNWFKKVSGNDYLDVVRRVVEKAKVGIENEGFFEFATKPSTNPMVALLEIYLLKELNLLDINDMSKHWYDVNIFKYKSRKGEFEYGSRNGTGYHLNIGSDVNIGVSDNLKFIQNFCTILPRSGICNGENVSIVNRSGNCNLRFKSSKFYVFPGSKGDNYVEFRTYSVDDVELFEKNVLFNTYAVMGVQAQEKVSYVNHDIVMNLKDEISINNSEDLMSYLESNNLFMGNQDLKSKKIAVEFMFMQICILRAISDYNKNFIDNELFGENLLGNLLDSWKDFLFDLGDSGKNEIIGFMDGGMSYTYVKNRCPNLVQSFNVQEYIGREDPFSDEEVKIIVNKNGDSVPEGKIHLVTRWLNKKLLWAKLCEGVIDTESLEKLVNDKLQNIGRIKSFLRSDNPILKIDREYLLQYFKSKMSLAQFNPYDWITTDFVNRIINLNNFFLKKDDTNANGVLQTTILDGNIGDELDISKFSIFETGYMRKGYNYYQGGSENMLIHSAQKIALNYMENVKNILNTDYEDEMEGGMMNQAA